MGVFLFYFQVEQRTGVSGGNQLFLFSFGWSSGPGAAGVHNYFSFLSGGAADRGQRGDIIVSLFFQVIGSVAHKRDRGGGSRWTWVCLTVKDLWDTSRGRRWCTLHQRCGVNAVVFRKEGLRRSRSNPEPSDASHPPSGFTLLPENGGALQPPESSYRPTASRKGGSSVRVCLLVEFAVKFRRGAVSPVGGGDTMPTKVGYLGLGEIVGKAR